MGCGWGRERHECETEMLGERVIDGAAGSKIKQAMKMKMKKRRRGRSRSRRRRDADGGNGERVEDGRAI